MLGTCEIIFKKQTKQHTYMYYNTDNSINTPTYKVQEERTHTEDNCIIYNENTINRYIVTNRTLLYHLQ